MFISKEKLLFFTALMVLSNNYLSSILKLNEL